MWSQWVPVLALCATLLGCFIAAMKTALTVGTMIGDLRRTLEQMSRWADSVAVIPRLVDDLREVKTEVSKLRSLVPPMRERLDSVNEDVSGLPERVTRLEAKLSGERHAVEVPRPDYRPRRKDERSE